MEVVVGDRKEKSNPFRCNCVKLNLPGDSKYDPTMPRVYKWDENTNSLACECKFFCDDFRIIGPNAKATRAATHRLETTMAYLGIQDATRKRRKITQTPGEWTGSIFFLSVEEVGVFVTVSKRKWDRAQTIINKWSELLSATAVLPLLEYKALESDIEFLIHLSMSYPIIKPFLRGFYLTLNSWREGRDKAGWKISEKAYNLFLQLGRRSEESEDSMDMDVASSEEDALAPTHVRAKPLMREHIGILVEMFSATDPVLRLVRGSAILEALYIFGDASGLGFGSSWLSGRHIRYRFGVWGGDSKTSTTSNYRELHNLVETLERSGLDGELKGKEIFLFTDNSTAESIAAKGSSTSPLLFELVTRLYKLSMNFMCLVNIISVAGMKMIEQGTDGLSRGDLLEGVLNGQRMLSFIPLHLSALDRALSLKNWISSWVGTGRQESIEFLSHKGWFERGHDINGYRVNCDGRKLPTYLKGIFIWTPPPAAARQALEELRQARHKRQVSTHVFIVPHLMAPEWKTQLYKTADLIFTRLLVTSIGMPRTMNL